MKNPSQHQPIRKPLSFYERTAKERGLPTPLAADIGEISPNDQPRGHEALDDTARPLLTFPFRTLYHYVQSRMPVPIQAVFKSYTPHDAWLLYNAIGRGDEPLERLHDVVVMLRTQSDAIAAALSASGSEATHALKPADTTAVTMVPAVAQTCI